MSYTALYEHIIFAPKFRTPCISNENEERLFRYIWGIIKAHKCKLIQINACLNHVHMLIDRHPSVSTSDLIAHIKRASSLWITQNKVFINFNGWSREYAAIAVSPTVVDAVREYIRKQKEHHLHIGFEDEYKGLTPGREFFPEYFDK